MHVREHVAVITKRMIAAKCVERQKIISISKLNCNLNGLFLWRIWSCFRLLFADTNAKCCTKNQHFHHKRFWGNWKTISINFPVDAIDWLHTATYRRQMYCSFYYYYYKLHILNQKVSIFVWFGLTPKNAKTLSG